MLRRFRRIEAACAASPGVAYAIFAVGQSLIVGCPDNAAEHDAEPERERQPAKQDHGVPQDVADESHRPFLPFVTGFGSSIGMTSCSPQS
jgi:hypothetical protein